MQPQRSAHSEGINLERLNTSALNIVEAACSVVAMPVEIILRPWYGTRYFPPPIICFAALLMILLPAISAVITGLVSLIPFGPHIAPPVGIISMSLWAQIFFLQCAVHAVRLYRRMTRMHTEACSTYEGPPLPFFALIPWSRSWWLTRIVIEPVFVLIAATVLHDLLIIQSGLATYLQFAAVTLAMKEFIAWYVSWQYLRDLMDAKNAGPILAKLVDNQATEAELSTINLASFPADIPEEIRTQAAISIARAYSAADQTNS
jgi:hypothetical protein